MQGSAGCLSTMLLVCQPTNPFSPLCCLQYMVKPCVRGFGELPSDNEYDAGELSLAVDDYNPGCASFMCFPCCYNRLTLTCKVRAEQELLAK